MGNSLDACTSHKTRFLLTVFGFYPHPSGMRSETERLSWLKMLHTPSDRNKKITSICGDSHYKQVDPTQMIIFPSGETDAVHNFIK